MKLRVSAILAVWAASLVCLWVYWTGLVEVAYQWDRRPEYSHGWMVVLFAVFLLWTRRQTLGEKDSDITRAGLGLLGLGACAWMGPWLFETTGVLASASQWVGIALSTLGFAVMVSSWIGEDDVRPSPWGVPVLLAAIGMRLAAAQVYMEWFDLLSLLPFIAGLVLLMGGWRMLRWSWVAIAFLFFMIPLPHTLEVAMRNPLQRLGTITSTYVMQTLGLPAFAEGNVVTVNDVGINVVEACSGLRMMMVFFALSVGLAITLERPVWQRLVIAVSAVPIALITNITRIIATGLLYVWGYDELAEDVFHDFAGWLMPLMGLTLLWLEMWYLDHLFIVDEKIPLSFGMTGRREISSRAAN